MVASPGVYETCVKGAEAAGLALFLNGRDRFFKSPGDAFVRASNGVGQRAFAVRVRVEIIGEVEVAVVPRKDGGS